MIPDIKLHLLRGVWNCSTVTVDFLFWCSIGVAGENKVPGDSPHLRHLTLQRVMKDNPVASYNTSFQFRWKLFKALLKLPFLLLQSEYKHCKDNCFKCSQKNMSVTQQMYINSNMQQLDSCCCFTLAQNSLEIGKFR